MDEDRRILTLSVASREEIDARVRRAASGVPQGARITFTSLDLLWRVITPRRLDILRTMAGGETMTIREVARRVGRDVKAVHGDVRSLVEAGLLDETQGGVRFDYDGLHLDVVLMAA